MSNSVTMSTAVVIVFEGNAVERVARGRLFERDEPIVQYFSRTGFRTYIPNPYCDIATDMSDRTCDGSD
jgi:hypothetical protein